MDTRHPIQSVEGKMFPYYGGKSRVAEVVWERFGTVRNYLEPFCGGAALLLHRPDVRLWPNERMASGEEVVNDLDGFVINFMNAVKNAPGKVAEACDDPPNELLLNHRHRMLCQQAPEVQGRIMEDPHWFDPTVAGWWAYGMCLAVNWGQFATKPGIKLHLRLGDHSGLFRRKLRQSPSVRHVYLSRLQARLRGVHLCCRDGVDFLREAVLRLQSRRSPTAVFLDPVYYGCGDTVYRVGHHARKETIERVVEWCKSNGDRPNLRIALCGHDGDYDLPPGWSRHSWESLEGGRRRAEVIWFSPHCLPAGEE